MTEQHFPEEPEVADLSHPPGITESDVDAFLKQRAGAVLWSKLNRLKLAFGGANFWPHELRPVWPETEAGETEEKKNLMDFLYTFTGENFIKMAPEDRKAIWKGAVLYYGLSESDFPYPANLLAADMACESPGYTSHGYEYTRPTASCPSQAMAVL